MRPKPTYKAVPFAKGTEMSISTPDGYPSHNSYKAVPFAKGTEMGVTPSEGNNNDTLTRPSPSRRGLKCDG